MDINESQNWYDLINSDPYLLCAVSLVKSIETSYPGSTTLIVGGSVRDLILQRPVTDIDIATNVPIENLVRDYKTHDIGKSKDFGIVVIEFSGNTYEVAHFRQDGTYSDNRHPDAVNFVDTFKADSARRDFTINSMGITDTGALIDYNGGLADISNRVIETVGNASERFNEDAIRILRAARFAATLDFQIGMNTHAAMVSCRNLLANISKERIAGELYKAAKSGLTLARFIEKLDEVGILEDILPEVHAFHPFVHALKHHPEGGGRVFGHVMEAIRVSRSTDPIVNVSILFHDLGKATTYVNRDGKHTYYGHEQAGVPIIAKIAERLKFSADDTKSFQFAAANHMHVHNLDKLSIKKLVQIVNDENWSILREVSFADEACRGPGLFDPVVFKTKIDNAEERVQKLNARGGPNGLKRRIKEHVDGNRLLEWIPELNEKENRKQIGVVLSTVQDWLLKNIDEGLSFTQDEVIGKARETFYGRGILSNKVPKEQIR